MMQYFWELGLWSDFLAHVEFVNPNALRILRFDNSLLLHSGAWVHN